MDIGSEIENAIDEYREKRLSIQSRIPLMNKTEDERLKDIFLSLTKFGTRLLDNFPIRELFEKVYGSVGPYIFRLLAGIKPTDSFLDNVTGYLRITTLWGLFDIEIISAGDTRIEVKYSVCPLGISDEEKMCEAYMAMEPRISEKDYFNAYYYPPYSGISNVFLSPLAGGRFSLNLLPLVGGGLRWGFWVPPILAFPRRGGKG